MEKEKLTIDETVEQIFNICDVVGVVQDYKMRPELEKILKQYGRQCCDKDRESLAKNFISGKDTDYPDEIRE